MDHPGFWPIEGPLTLKTIAQGSGARIPEAFSARAEEAFTFVAPLEDAGPSEITFFENRKYLDTLAKARAGAVFIAEAFAERVPSGTVPLITKAPHLAFAKTIEMFVPAARFPQVAFPEGRPTHAEAIAPSARIEDGVVIEPGAVIGAEAQIGRGTRIAAGAVIGYRVAIGRDCFIGPGAAITHSLIGNRVIIHAGARLGQDGYGYVPGAQGHHKIPQIGRVIVQDDVEIGANTTIDRGALRDTIIGEGTKIDNLVQIGHNVVIGRHCFIISQTGISGSTVVEDFVGMGGQVGIVGHIRIGAGAQIAAKSGVSESVPAGARWSGYPAQPSLDWLREVALLRRMTKTRSHGSDRKQSDEPNT